MEQASLTPETLAAKLESLFNEPARLAEAAHAALKTARHDAAERLADIIMAEIGSNGGQAQYENNKISREEAA